MIDNDNEQVVDFVCGAIIPKEIYEKAKKKCEEANTTIYELIKAVIYQLANGEIRIAKRQELTKEEAKDHPKKNVLMRALGATEKVQMDIFDVDMNNEGILLCSDGLTTMLADDQIEKVLIDEELDAEEKVVKLIQKCNARGGFDNVSIAYLEKDEGDN